MNKFKETYFISPERINEGVHENELSRYYSIFKSPTFIIYTSQIASCIKAEIEHHFPGTKFLIDCRIKSEPSTRKKLEENLKKANTSGKILKSPVLFDLIGMTIVIYDIPSNSDLLENKRIKYYMNMQKNIKKEKTLFHKYKKSSLHKIKEIMSNGGYTPENLDTLSNLVKKISGIGTRACVNNVKIAQQECRSEIARELKLFIEDAISSGKSFDEVISDLKSEYQSYFSFTCQDLAPDDLQDDEKKYLLINLPNNKQKKLVVNSLMQIKKQKDIKDFPMQHNAKIMEYLDNILEFQEAEKQVHLLHKKVSDNISLFKNKCPFFEETLYKLYIDLDKLFPIVEKANKNNLEFAKDEANSKASNDILNYLINDSELLTKHMGLKSISERRKHMNKSNGYITEHSTVTSNLLNNYILEILARSGHRNEIAKTGSAAHSSRETKKRNLPQIPENNTFPISTIKEQRRITPVFLVASSIEGDYTVYSPGFLTSHISYFVNEFEPRDKHGAPIEKDYFFTKNDKPLLRPNTVDQFLGTNLYNEPNGFKDQHTVISKWLDDYNKSNESKEFNQFLKDYYDKEHDEKENGITDEVNKTDTQEFIH